MIEHVGKYRLIERIAVGGTAEVFLAAALRPGGEELVVLKRVLPQYARVPRFQQLFREEALVVARLEHPNIVRLVDFGEMQDTFFLALEHVDGADLALLLEGAARVGRPIGHAHAARIAADVATALAFLHAQTSDDGLPLKIVHRDVSPHNILLSFAGEVKLADFGIARSVIRADRTTDGTIKGKFAYMSPEQARGERELDAATDVFALGAVLYEMLFGAPPFKGANDVDTLERIKRGGYELPAGALLREHRALAPLLRRCLDGDPRARPLAAELADTLGVHGDLSAEPLGAWVSAVAPPRGEDLDRVAEKLLRRAGNTAVLAVRPGGSASPAPAPSALAADRPSPSTRPRSTSLGVSRLRLGLLLVGVAAATALLTLLLVRRDPGEGLLTDQRSRGRSRDARVAVRGRDARAVRSSDGAGAAPADLAAVAPADRAAAAPADLALPRDAAAPPPRRRLRSKLPASGRLTVNSIPWAHVFVDGRRVGTTPISGLRLTVGRHRVILKTAEGRVLRTFVTRITKGRTATHSFDHSR